MLTEASRGGHLSVANLLLRQPRMQQPAPLSASTRSSSKDYHHYDRIKLATGKKSSTRSSHLHQTHQHPPPQNPQSPQCPHHHQQQQQQQAAGGSGGASKPPPTQKMAGSVHFGHPQPGSAPPSVTGHNSSSPKTQRKVQAPSAQDRGVGSLGGPSDPGGGAASKRQKISEKESNQDPSSTNVPPRNIPRVESPDYTPDSSADPHTTTTATDVPPPPHHTPPTTTGGVSHDLGQLTPEDILVRYMLQIAQAQSVGVPATAPSHPNLPPPPAASGIPVVPSSAASLEPQHHVKSGKPTVFPQEEEGAHNFVCRGSFASTVPLFPTPGSSASATPPTPAFQTQANSSGSVSSTEAAIHPTPLPPPLHPTNPPPPPPLSASLSNAELNRLLPHLETIAASLQNASSLESHYFAALAQAHLLPTLGEFDPTSPFQHHMHQAPCNNSSEGGNAVSLFASGSSVIVDPDKPVPIPPPPDANVAAVPALDPVSFLANLDMSALVQNLAHADLPNSSELPPEIPAQPVYPAAAAADFESLKQLSEKMQTASPSSPEQSGVGEGGGGGHVDVDVVSSHPRPLSASFSLDYNFPMDIPPPTDLLPDDVRLALPCHSAYIYVYVRISS